MIKTIYFVRYALISSAARSQQYVVILFAKCVYMNTFSTSWWVKQKCPNCKRKLRYTKDFGASKSLDNLIQVFLDSCDDRTFIESYTQRKEENRLWTERRKLQEFYVGKKIDIRSPEYVWCVGIIKRILFRGENQKRLIVVTYENLPSIYNEEIVENSSRLAAFGVFTSRSDLPKLIFDDNGRKQVILFGSEFNFNFVDKFRGGDELKKLVETDSSYVSESDEDN